MPSATPRRAGRTTRPRDACGQRRRTRPITNANKHTGTLPGLAIDSITIRHIVPGLAIDSTAAVRAPHAELMPQVRARATSARTAPWHTTTHTRTHACTCARPTRTHRRAAMRTRTHSLRVPPAPQSSPRVALESPKYPFSTDGVLLSVPLVPPTTRASTREHHWTTPGANPE